VRAVNLLPKDDVQRSRKPQNVPALVSTAAIVLVTGLVGVLYFSANSAVAVKEMELRDAQAELELLPSPAELDAEHADERQLAGEHSARLSALSTALAHRVSWDRVLREISLVLPEDVWLRDLVAASPTPPGAAAQPPSLPGQPPTGFSISGYTYSHDAVARLLSRLSVIPDLENVWLERSARAVGGGRPIVTFSIKASVRAGGVS
jgi:Tfp pilus assembly protein PilN